MSNITILGTGLLGAAFAEAAAKRGDTVTVWNRSPEKAQALTAFGLKVAATAAEAVRGATRVHLILKDDAVVDEVIEAARPGLAADAVLIDHSTTLPRLTAERAARLQAEGLRYLHCPVFMGPAAARQAQGTMLAAGSQALFDEVKNELAKMTGRLEYLGERPDLGAVNKLLGNTMLIGSWAVLADVLTVAKAGGVAPEEAIRMLGVLDFNNVVALRGGNMARGNFAPSFELSMARKDIGLMLDATGGMPLSTLQSIADRMDQLIAAGHGSDDASVLGIDAVRGA